MGSGYRDWVDGETVTEPNFQGYIQDQVVMSFATGTARDAAITSPAEGMVAYIRDLDRLSVYDGDSWEWLAYYGTWSPYTPLLKGSVRDCTIGNGTTQGFQVRMGTLVRFYAEITYGSTTVAALGNLSMTVPVAPRTTIGQWASCQVEDTSASKIYPGQAGALNATTVPLYTQSGTGGSLERMTDITPGGEPLSTGDSIRMWGSYEVLV